MTELGELIASGRDADIYACGAGRVLRRTRDGRSLAQEAQLMEHLRLVGYPIPRVFDVSDDGRDLVMERVEGPNMLDAAARRPWRLRRYARDLGALHQRLHEIAAPPDLRPSPMGGGPTVVHLDLHPLNVLVTPSGPMVIDWSNAAAGHADDDVAAAWLLLATAEVRAKAVERIVAATARGWFVQAFIDCFDRNAVTKRLPAVVDWKMLDRHMSDAERASMRSFALRETGRTPS